MVKHNCLNSDQMHYLVSTFNIDTTNTSMLLKADFSPTGEFLGYTETIRNTVIEKEYDIPSFSFDDIVQFFPKFQLSTCTGGYEILFIPNTQNYLPGAAFPKTVGKTLMEVAYKMLVLALRKHYI